MNIILVSRRSTKELWKHEFFRDFLKEHIPGISVQIVCGETNPGEWIVKPDVSYLYEDYESFLIQSQDLSDLEIARLQSLQAHIAPSPLYKSSRAYQLKQKSDRELALRMIYIIDKTQKIIQKINPQFVFMTGGAELVQTAFFCTAQYLNIPSYRILDVTHLNPNCKGSRYWFCSNNYCRLSPTEENQFGYDQASVMSHAKDLVFSISSNQYKLDNYARNTSRFLWVGFKSIKAGLIQKTLVSLKHLKKELEYQLKPREVFSAQYTPLENAILNRRLATNPLDLPKPFFLFPLNIPMDAQIILRSPQWKDGLSVCEQVSNVLPYNYSLVVKEHPGYPGMIEHYRLKSFLRSHPNVFYLEGDVRLWDILPDSAALITVNSTSALEALAQNIPVVTLGEAFYRGSGLTYDVASPLDLQTTLTEVIADPKQENRNQLLLETIAKLLQETVPSPGQVISSEEDQYLNIIAEGMVSKIRRKGL